MVEKEKMVSIRMPLDMWVLVVTALSGKDYAQLPYEVINEKVSKAMRRAKAPSV